MAENGYNEGDKIRRWKVLLDDPSPALEIVGLLMVSASVRAFKMQRFGKHQWKQRGAVNTFGLIADFHGGAKAPKSKRFDRTPALMDKGHGGGLVSTINHKVTGKFVTVAANKPYADIHQTGGVSKSKPITKQVRFLLYAWLRTKKGGKFKRKLGWLLNDKFKGKTLETTVRKRPFIGLTKATLQDIEESIGAKLLGVN